MRRLYSLKWGHHLQPIRGIHLQRGIISSFGFLGLLSVFPESFTGRVILYGYRRSSPYLLHPASDRSRARARPSTALDPIAADMTCCSGSVFDRVHIQPRKHVLDPADRTAPTGLHELDITDLP